jgi:tRNA A-37 threonylcarbamoyl transferase component Bud32/tetratricopeptide (TPR) repeat protein
MSAEPASPAALDHYRLERRLAIGGMAEVWLAQDQRDGRPVAIKKILPQISNDQAFLERFFHEIRIQIALKHRNVVELLDCSPAPHNAYIVMEYVDGGSLQTLTEKAGRFPWKIALHVAEEALKGLGAAHRKGIVHRDVKPHNIMWKRDGAVKIADFGISQAEHLTRLTVTGMVVGTPAHMSPEQAKGEVLDSRSDLFSIGTVLYELLTGVNPFVTDQVTTTLRRVVEHEPDPPSLLDPTIPPSVDVVVRKLHAKKRDGRFATADEAIEAIRGVFAAEAVPHPGAVFREFLRDPAGFVAARKARIASEASARAEALLKDANAPPEQALWEAYRTLACAPESSTAKNLFAAAAQRAGQRDSPLDNARIRELEEQLKRDPENVAVLLQLAKLYRLERDFINVMRFFRRLQTVAPRDAYTQGQIAALVGGATFASAPKKVAGPSPAPASTALTPVARALLLAAAVALAALCVWWARRPRVDLTSPSDSERARAQAVVNLLRKGSVTLEPIRLPVDGETLQRALEKGALLEKEAGPARALAHYRDVLGHTKRPSEKSVLLVAIADLSSKAGDREGTIAALDDAIALGGTNADAARFRKADLLETARDEAGALKLYEELASSEDADTQRKAKLRIAMSADRAGDVQRALALYEELLARSPSSSEADAARLGAAALYRAAGRKADAQRMYEDVLKSAAPGSDFEKSAQHGLKTLE